MYVQGGGRGDMLPESTGGWVPGVELTDEEGALAARKQEAGSAPARVGVGVHPCLPVLPIVVGVCSGPATSVLGAGHPGLSSCDG